MTEVKAPGVIKLFGEHAVVYGKLSVAAAIGMRASAKIGRASGNKFSISLPDLQVGSVIERARMDDLYKSYRTNEIKDFIGANSDIERAALPYAVIAARLYSEHHLNPFGAVAELTSEIPLQRGYASSAACSTALAAAFVKEGRIELSDSQIIDVARDGDRIIHSNPNAGAIDVNASYYGGVVSFGAKLGAKKEQCVPGIKIVLIDTGPKKSTAETVGHIAELYKRDKDYVERMTDVIQEYSLAGLDALRRGDMKRVGELMYSNHKALRALGVSSEGLDRAVELGRANGAYGVKLSGGGGGGIAIAVGADPNALAEQMNAAGFKSRVTEINNDGAYNYLED